MKNTSKTLDKNVTIIALFAVAFWVASLICLTLYFN